MNESDQFVYDMFVSVDGVPTVNNPWTINLIGEVSDFTITKEVIIKSKDDLVRVLAQNPGCDWGKKHPE